MDRIGITTVLAVVSLVMGCGIPDEVGTTEYDRKAIGTAPEEKLSRPICAMPNPAAVYCLALGYEYAVVPDEEGDEWGFCVFPDGSACESWSFYRGMCCPERSHCGRQGYSVKELARNEGWFEGAVCVEPASKKEIGSVYDLLVRDFLNGQGD